MLKMLKRTCPNPCFGVGGHLYDVTDDVTGVLLSHPRFSSITSDLIEIEARERHYYDNELPNRLIRDLTS